MTGFELRISGVGSDRSTNCATTTVQTILQNQNCRFQTRISGVKGKHADHLTITTLYLF